MSLSKFAQITSSQKLEKHIIRKNVGRRQEVLVVGDLLREVLDVLVELVSLRRELLDLRLKVREGLLLLPTCLQGLSFIGTFLTKRERDAKFGIHRQTDLLELVSKWMQMAPNPGSNSLCGF